MSDRFSPAVVAFFKERDELEALCNSRGQLLDQAKERYDKVIQELRQSEHRNEFLQAEVNRVTDQRDVYSRTSVRTVAKVETMLKTITMMVEDLADEIRRAQFEEPDREKSEDEKFMEGEQWTEADLVKMRAAPADVQSPRPAPPPHQPSLQDIAEKVNFESRLKGYAVRPDPDEERNDDEENSDVDAERIGKQFGAGFPDDWREANQDQVGVGKMGSYVSERDQYARPSLFPDRGWSKGVDGGKAEARPPTSAKLPPGPFS